MPHDYSSRDRYERRDRYKRSRSRSRDRSRRYDRRRSRSRSPAPRHDHTCNITRDEESGWDCPPQGYEHLSAMQFKEMMATGLIDPQILLSSSGPGSIPGNTVARQARRLFVGNIPFACDPEDMKNFFNDQIIHCGLAKSEGNPVLACQINFDKNFAFLEFRCAEETSLVIRNLDGIHYQGQMLRLRRPQDYVPPPGEQDPPEVNAWGNQDSPNNLYIGGIPNTLSKEQVMEILTPFGKLKAFDLLMENAYLNRGFAFAEYEDGTVTDVAIEALNGLPIGDKFLAVRRARTGGKYIDNKLLLQAPVTVQVPGLDPVQALSQPSRPTEVLCLMNILTEDDLADDEEYEDIHDDIKEQCEVYGRVKSMEIPRPIPGVEVPGALKVFVEFETVEECQKAEAQLSGRKFNDRIVVTSYVDPDKYHRREF